jgi:hypothetical protein
MKNICLNLGGGLGDILRVYLSGDVSYPWCQPFWGQLEKWKADNNGKRIKLIISSHNPAACQLFEFTPWVDEIVSIPWTESPKFDQIDNYINLEGFEATKLCKSYEWVQPQIYLRPDEKRQVAEIVNQGEFVFLYPFGNYGARLIPEQYVDLICKIVDDGWNVVVAGDSYRRNVKEGNHVIIEEFECNFPPGVINLVGINNARLTCSLSMKATIYIGSLGCYMHAAFANNVKSFILTCYEVLEDNNLLGSKILGSDPMWYIRKYIGTNEKFVDLTCLYNEKNLPGLWNDMISHFHFGEGQFRYWGKAEEKRVPIHV